MYISKSVIYHYYHCLHHKWAFKRNTYEENMKKVLIMMTLENAKIVKESFILFKPMVFAHTQNFL